MELNSCPADEADYVDAFIHNLKSDIRLRLESKGRLGMRSLRDVFSDAQFMESLISIEDAFKKIASKFEDPFDKMPNRAPADNFEDKLQLNSEYNVELQETKDVSLEKTVDGIDTPSFTAAKEEAVIKLDHEHSEMADLSLAGLSSSSSPIVIEDSAYSLALEALIWLFEEDEKSPPSMLEDADNSHESPTKHLLDQTEEVGQLRFLTVRSVKDGRHLLVEMPQKILTSLQEIPEDSKSLFLGEGCNSATKLGVVKVVYKVFDEMSRPFSVQPNEETSGHKSYIPLVDCVPQVFYPGSVTNEFSYLIIFPRIDIEFCKGEISRLIFDPGGHSVCYMGCSKIIKVFDPGDEFETAAVGWRFDSVSTRFHTFDKMPKPISLERTKGNGGKVLFLTFDPRGNPLYHKGCSFFEPNNVIQNFDFRLNESDSALVDQRWTDLYSRHENDLVCVAFGECKNVLYFLGYDALFLFDPGRSYHLLRTWKWNGDFEICKEQQGHNMMREIEKYVVFSFDPGGNTFGNTSGYQNVLLQEVAHHIKPLVVGLNGDRLLGSMLSFGPEMVWQRTVVQFCELREIKRAPIVISIAHFSEKIWVTIYGPKVKGSSVEKEMEDCRLSIMYIVLDLLRPRKLVLVSLLSELKHSKLYLTSNGYDGAIPVKLRNLVWEFLTCTSVNAFRSMGFDCVEKFNALSLVLMTMQT